MLHHHNYDQMASYSQDLPKSCGIFHHFPCFCTAMSGVPHFQTHPNIWVNYNISLTWIKAIWGWFPLLTMIPVRSQWGRYNLPRNIILVAVYPSISSVQSKVFFVKSPKKHTSYPIVSPRNTLKNHHEASILLIFPLDPGYTHLKWTTSKKPSCAVLTYTAKSAPLPGRVRRRFLGSWPTFDSATIWWLILFCSNGGFTFTIQN